MEQLRPADRAVEENRSCARDKPATPEGHLRSRKTPSQATAEALRGTRSKVATFPQEKPSLVQFFTDSAGTVAPEALL